MKLHSTRIVTENVPALARFYQEITGIAPDGGEDYVEFATVGETLAISSKRATDLYNAGASTPASNRSLIIEFEVDDVDNERLRLKEIVKTWVMEPTTQPWGNRSMLF